MPPKRQAASSATSSPAQPATANTSASTPSKSSKAAKPAPQSASQILSTIVDRYTADTPQRVKLLDAFLGFLVLLGAIQFVYVVLVGNYPFNAFLAGFSATVGQFVLTVSLRMQTNPENKKGNFESISDERAFADFVFGSLILHLFCINFIN